MLKAPSSLVLNTSREREFITSLGNMFQCLTALIGKNFFAIYNLNLPSLSIKPFLLVLSQQALVKCPSPAFL